MNSKHLILLLFLLFILFSCKKSNKVTPPPINLNGTYQADTAQNLSAVQMYTVNGQVTNQNLINTFVKRYAFATHSTAMPFEINPFIVNIKNNVSATAIANTGNKVDTTNYSFLSNSSSGFVVRAADSIGIPFTLSGGGILTEVTSLYPVEFGKGCYISGGVGNAPCYYRPSLQFDIKNNQIYLPYFSCQLSQDINHHNAIYNVEGDFNTQITKQLAVGDTLIFQTKAFLLVKK